LDFRAGKAVMSLLFHERQINPDKNLCGVLKSVFMEYGIIPQQVIEYFLMG
jgi:hypothetical protein